MIGYAHGGAALALRQEVPHGLSSHAERTAAALLLLGLDMGVLEETEIPLPVPLSCQNALLERVQKALMAEAEAASAAVFDRLGLPLAECERMLHLSVPYHTEWTVPDEPVLVVEPTMLYWSSIPVSTLPRLLSEAVVVAVHLVSRWFPLLVDSDLLEGHWWMMELQEEARLLAQSHDLDAMTGDALMALVSSDDNPFHTIREFLEGQESPEAMIDLLRSLTHPASPSLQVVLGERPTEALCRIRLKALLNVMSDGSPALRDHPMWRWCQAVWQVADRRYVDGRDCPMGLLSPEDGEWVTLEHAFAVTFGEHWEGHVMEYHFQALQFGEETAVGLLPLDALASFKTRAILMAMAEGAALLSALTLLL